MSKMKRNIFRSIYCLTMFLISFYLNKELGYWYITPLIAIVVITILISFHYGFVKK
ncbi:hypothetical protein R9X47_14700 [Wukongibacter baidiensis]|uniref:hypothetical protein n=1 Tax=Wukongibacter baidiensis TaxID=1723361 RepID=UPI003D7FE402